MADSSENSNGVLIEGVGDSEESGFHTKIKKSSHHHQGLGEVTLYTIFSNLINVIFFRSPNSRYGSAHLLHRINVSVYENIPLLRDASTNSGRHVLAWARRGSPLRLLLVVSVRITVPLLGFVSSLEEQPNQHRALIDRRLSDGSVFTDYTHECNVLDPSWNKSLEGGTMPRNMPWVGTIFLLTLTGLLVFMLFFAAATINAIVISLFMSLVAAGMFLALFFACVATIYVGALSIAVCAISTATTLAIIAVLIATGWIGFFCTVWLVTKKSVNVAKHSLYITGSTISSYSSARHTSHHPGSKKLE